MSSVIDGSMALLGVTASLATMVWSLLLNQTTNEGQAVHMHNDLATGFKKAA